MEAALAAFAPTSPAITAQSAAHPNKHDLILIVLTPTTQAAGRNTAHALKYEFAASTTFPATALGWPISRKHGLQFYKQVDKK
jgi:hypothetical protein